MTDVAVTWYVIKILKSIFLFKITIKTLILFKALQTAGDLYRITKMLGVNIGGLQAAVYVLKRTDTPYEQFKPKAMKHTKCKNN